jgi:hypothetical protein
MMRATDLRVDGSGASCRGVLLRRTERPDHHVHAKGSYDTSRTTAIGARRAEPPDRVAHGARCCPRHTDQHVARFIVTTPSAASCSPIWVHERDVTHGAEYPGEAADWRHIPAAGCTTSCTVSIAARVTSGPSRTGTHRSSGACPGGPYACSSGRVFTGSRRARTRGS